MLVPLLGLIFIALSSLAYATYCILWIVKQAVAAPEKPAKIEIKASELRSALSVDEYRAKRLDPAHDAQRTADLS